MFDYETYNEEKYKEDFWTINRSKDKWFSNYVKLKIFKKWARGCEKEVFLDAGGGVGNWAFYFLNDYKKVIVLDVSKEALRKIPEKEIIKIKGSVLKINLKDESVDCILLADIFEHIACEDLGKMLIELKRVLKKNGKIIIFTSLYGVGISSIINRILGKMKGRLFSSEIKEGHLNRLKIFEIKKLMEDNNLKIEDYYFYSIIFQQITDGIKDNFAWFVDKIKGERGVRKGQVTKEKLKKAKKNILFLSILKLFSFISYLDILLFGKIILGDSVFLKIKNTERE